MCVMGRKNIPDKVRRARKQAENAVEERAIDPSITLSGPPGWTVRMIQPARAAKEYRCPGCNQEIKPGVAHVVAWRNDDEQARRHWHRGCFDIAKRGGRL